MEHTEKQPAKITKRKSPAKVKRSPQNSSAQLNGSENIVALKKRISKLEQENKSLREQIAALTASANRPVESYRNSVREQQHNFFKYSNIRRY